MNQQQVGQPRSSANGYGRRRIERESGSRPEHKLQSGKTNLSKPTNAGVLNGSKAAGYESPSRERLVYLTTCLIGHNVEVQLEDGSLYSGIFHAANAEEDCGIILKMACLIWTGSSRGQKSTLFSVSKACSGALIIPAEDLVQITAKDVSVTRDGTTSDLQRVKQQDIMLDSSISQSSHVDVERALERWVPDKDYSQCPELENIFDNPWKRVLNCDIGNDVGVGAMAMHRPISDDKLVNIGIGDRNFDTGMADTQSIGQYVTLGRWDQFEANEMLFGVKSTFDEELYTTKLERGPKMRELEREALRIAREIEGEETLDLHLAEERGFQLHGNFDIDEETRFSSVFRGVDDTGYDENENILLDSRNIETFGSALGSSISGPFTVLTRAKSNEGNQVPSCSSTMDEVQSSVSSTTRDLQRSSSSDHYVQLASEFLSKSSALDSESSILNFRIQENQLSGQHVGNNYIKESVEKQMVAEEEQMLKSEDPELSAQMWSLTENNYSYLCWTDLLIVVHGSFLDLCFDHFAGYIRKQMDLSYYLNLLEYFFSSPHGHKIFMNLAPHTLSSDWGAMTLCRFAVISEGKKDGPSIRKLSPNATSYDRTSLASSKCLEKMSLPSELSADAAPVKTHGASQSATSRGWPGSSTSSTSEFGAVAPTSSCPGLSPSSSMGSFSEKSTLNPHAKEFKLNPNAKSFMPSQTPLRPASLVSDGSSYFPAVSHMHGMPVGVGK
ncbi:hypothetical protein Acr_19g0010600 [Actinidia rufa]|uniref:Sm domain-containing protein n=1 Tax=Actinidia rufa TaxID=165716 RepID=A0A7J0GBG4_9ERIC|nr:hypothetical protein Acr_19g0010600 [Actinidia rufa]